MQVQENSRSEEALGTLGSQSMETLGSLVMDRSVVTDRSTQENSQPETLNPEKTPKLLELCRAVAAVLEAEPNLLRVPGACVFVGDLHGSLVDCLSAIALASARLATGWCCVFLGDYVDRGPDSLGVLEAVLALKLQFPGRVYLLRGNHEFASMNTEYGLASELTAKLGPDLGAEVFAAVSNLYPLLPLAALCCGGAVFACHGGVSPELSLQAVEAVDRRSIRETGQDPVVDALLWSDPRDFDGPNDERGIGAFFSAETLRAFLAGSGCSLLVRGHELADGVTSDPSSSCVTVFSCSDYLACGNWGAVLYVDATGLPEEIPLYFNPAKGHKLAEQAGPQQVQVQLFNSNSQLV